MVSHLKLKRKKKSVINAHCSLILEMLQCVISSNCTAMPFFLGWRVAFPSVSLQRISCGLAKKFFLFVWKIRWQWFYLFLIFFEVFLYLLLLFAQNLLLFFMETMEDSNWGICFSAFGVAEHEYNWRLKRLFFVSCVLEFY